MKILILFHAKCNDGKTAAAVIHAKYSPNDHEVKSIPVCYSKPLPEIDSGYFHKIYVVDFAYHGADLELLCTKSEQIIMLDHHKTAQEKFDALSIEEVDALPDNLHLVLDMKRSGAMIAWDYCHPDTPYHPIVRDVGMRDLWVDNWKEEYPNALFLHLALQTTPMKRISLALYSDVALKKANINSDFYHEFVKQGRAISAYVDTMIKDHIAIGEYIQIHERSVFAVNCPGHIVSELSDKVKSTADVIMCYTIQNDDGVHLSFRSNKQTAKPTAEIFPGGGGHDNSAGALVNKQTLFDILGGHYARR